MHYLCSATFFKLLSKLCPVRSSLIDWTSFAVGEDLGTQTRQMQLNLSYFTYNYLHFFFFLTEWSGKHEMINILVLRLQFSGYYTTNLSSYKECSVTISSPGLCEIIRSVRRTSAMARIDKTLQPLFPSKSYFYVYFYFVFLFVFFLNIFYGVLFFWFKLYTFFYYRYLAGTMDNS